MVIQSLKKSMSHTFKAKFTQETMVNLVQIYFSDQQSALYKLDVIVSVDDKLIFHQSMNESSFARYVRYKRCGQSQKENGECKPTPDECLSLALNCQCSEMTVKLLFGYTSTSLPTKASKESSPPVTMVEFYGDLAASEDLEAAMTDYQSKVEEYQKQAAKLNRVGKSVQMLTLPVAGRPQEFVMIPFIAEKKSSAQSKVTASPKKEQIEPGSSLVAEDPADKEENAAE